MGPISSQEYCKTSAASSSPAAKRSKDALDQLYWIENARLADQFIDLVKAGDLKQFEKFIKGFTDNAHQLAEIANLAAKRINCKEIWLPFTTVAFSGVTPKNKIREIVIVSFRVDSVRRILSLSSEPTTRCSVCGPPRDTPDALPIILSEDPVLLFKQIGRLVSLPKTVGPPPLASAS